MYKALGRFVWAISGVGQSNGLVCSRAQERKKKERNRRLTANFAHVQPRLFEPIVTKFCLWGRVVDVITDAKFYGSYRTPPPQTPFPILNVHRPYNTVSTTVLHCYNRKLLVSNNSWAVSDKDNRKSPKKSVRRDQVSRNVFAQIFTEWAACRIKIRVISRQGPKLRHPSHRRQWQHFWHCAANEWQRSVYMPATRSQLDSHVAPTSDALTTAP